MTVLLQNKKVKSEYQNQQRVCIISICDSMSSLFHYTKLSNLKEIIKEDSIDFIATFYEKFNQDDYAWIKNNSESIVREICEQNGWRYDPDILSNRPYIISFCKSGSSEYMWNNYGDNGEGIVLEFNQEKLYQEAISTKNYACLIPCEYVNPHHSDKESIKQTILKIAQNDLLQENTDADRMIFAVMGIMQNKFHEEMEVRYVQIEEKLATAKCENGIAIIEDYEVPKDKWLRHLIFPKDILEKVVFGRDVCDEDVKTFKDYLCSIGYEHIPIEQAK